MKLLITTLLAFAAAAGAAVDKPPVEAFQQSQFELTFKTPSEFKQTASNTGYFPTPMGNVPYEENAWQGKKDTISTKVTVMPELWWQQRAAGAFAEAKENMLRQPGVRLISERDYAIGDCRAHSLIVALRTRFQRIDFILMKPDLRVIMYLSQKEAALSDVPCSSLFQSVSIKSKTAHTP